MFYLFQDLAGLALATLLAPLLLWLPGLGVARLCAPLGLKAASYWERIAWAMILGLAVLPVLDVLAIRAFRMPGMLWLNAILAVYGISWLRGDRRGFSPVFLWLALLWWIICAWSYIDIDLAGQLHHSLIAFDMVKHAAVIEQIVHQGIPFPDPFFARDGFAGYYHYFYVWAAAIRWVGGDTVSALTAFGATSFWTGIAVVALIWRIAFEAKLIRPGRGRRVLILIIAFCFVAGADLLFMLLRYLIVGRVEPDVDSWNTEVRMLGTSVLWVPHHVAAVLTAWAGMLLSVRARAQQGFRKFCLAAVAGTAFATMFGMSVWIALTIAPLLLVWTLIRLKARDCTLLIAGLAALLLSLPQLHDILAGRAAENFPIAFGVRPFTVIFPADTPQSQIWAMLLLPLSYALEFGLFALGARLYLRTRQPVDGEAAIVRSLIFWSACNALLVGSFLRSVLINNDLGWRSVLFAVIAALLWTLLPAQSIGSFRRIKPFALFLLILGASATIWDLAGLRVIRPPYFPTRTLEFTSTPELTHELRAAYGWASRNLPEGATLQHNANLTHRSLDFGLYGHHWPAVADREAILFGANRQDVNQRLAQLAPIFNGRALPQDLVNRSAKARIDYLLFTAKDQVWRAQGGPPPELTCLYRSTLLCIARARDFRP